MMRPLKLAAPGMFFFATLTLWAAENHVTLFPRLREGQVITYFVRYRSDKNVKTESNVAAPMAPNTGQLDVGGLLEVEILDVRPVGAKATIYARGKFLNLDYVAQKIESEGKSFEFTISPEGSAEKVSGLDSLSSEQQQAWQEWVARFALAWTLPAAGVRLGEKWKSEEVQQARAPIAELVWLKESTYVRNEPCVAKQVSISGELSAAGGPHDTCAVLLTTAALKQKSSPKDATPDDFKIHELKTTGTVKGTNEIITYISLKTGLVVRATEEANQAMDVTVAKADGSNRVHYNVNAKSHSEVFLVTETPLNHP
jgi:hypothetical protein